MTSLYEETWWPKMRWMFFFFSFWNSFLSDTYKNFFRSIIFITWLIHVTLSCDLHTSNISLVSAMGLQNKPPTLGNFPIKCSLSLQRISYIEQFPCLQESAIFLVFKVRESNKFTFQILLDKVKWNTFFLWN